MKKLTFFKGVIWQLILLFLFVNTQLLTSQKVSEKKTPIPADVNKIFQTSCMPCHGEKGGRMPTIKLNFSRWKGYNSDTRAEKASSICSSVREGTMPPGSVRESKPELMLTKDQIDLVCKWARSVKPGKSKK
jgi:mono/diheme cytochrome c family protein